MSEFPGLPDVVVSQPASRRLADAWATTSPEDRVAQFRALDPGEAGAFFLDLPAPDQAALLHDLTPPERRVWLRILAPDDAADVVQSFEAEEQPEVVAMLDPRARAQVQALLTYRTDVAGGRMNPDYVVLRPEMTAEQAVTYLRLHAGETTSLVYYAYVLDGAGRLIGVTSFRDLITAPSQRTVREIMLAEVVSVRDDVDQEQVARLLQAHDLLALPVVDADGRMRGIVTADDVMDVIREEATEDIHRLGGMAPLDTSYRRATLQALYRKRIGWLVGLVFINIASSGVIAAFEETLQATIALAFFIPLLIDSGGNAGSQAATLMVRALATGDVGFRDWLRVTWRETRVGLTLGGTMGLAAGALAFYRGDEALAAVVGLTMVTVVVAANLIGTLLPFVLVRLRVDPATASSPLITTVADTTGLLIYFGIATVVLGT